MTNKLQYIHSPPEIFILSFSLRFFYLQMLQKNALLEGKKTQQICVRFPAWNL